MDYGTNWYQYQSKLDTGIWDHQNKKIIINKLSELTGTFASSRLIKVKAHHQNMLIHTGSGRIVLKSQDPFWVHHEGDTNVLVVGNQYFSGFVELNTGTLITRANSKLEEEQGGEVKWFYSDTIWTNYDEYEAWEIDEYMIPEYTLNQKTYLLYKRGKYLVLDYANHDSILVIRPNDGKIHKIITGNLFWTDKWLVLTDDGKYGARDDDGRTYYNRNFDVEIERFTMYNLGSLELSKILGKEVRIVRELATRVVSNPTGLYHYKDESSGKYGIYSVYKEKDLIKPVDFLFYLGEDIHRGHGFSFYVVEEPYFGFFSTNYGWEVEPDKKGIQLLALSDGTYAYLADNMLYPKYGPNWQTVDSVPRQVTENDLKNSIVQHHITEVNNKLLVSGRFSYRDDHDDAYYSNTNYINSYGLIGYGEDTTYLTGRIHTVEYFDNHYIIQTSSNSYGYPDNLLILNENLDTLDISSKLRYCWIWNGMFLTNYNKSLVEYDLINKKVKRILGPAYEARDFHVKDGYLLLGHNEYSRYDRRRGDYHFDIACIIKPDGTMVNLNNMIALDIIGEDLALVGQLPPGTEIEGSFTNFPIRRHFKPSETAILDIRTGKLLTSWDDWVYVRYGVVCYSKGKSDDEVKIKVKNFRSWIKN